MKYFELLFKISPNNEAAGDVLAALLAEGGCETFVPTDEGLNAYVQQSFYDEETVSNAAAALSSILPDTTATFTCREVPDENWNATWEAEHHFEPITLPDGQVFQIIPRQAFGSGEHATTRMMLDLLAQGTKNLQDSSLPLAGKTVIDAGCGTGVLGIAAMKLGAAEVFAYDIDEWSVRNAEENFELNGYPLRSEASCIRILEGDASILGEAPEADLLLANINRNILLADLPVFASKLKPGARLFLSGFLEEDIVPLVSKASSLGLKHESSHADGDWRALTFSRL